MENHTETDHTGTNKDVHYPGVGLTAEVQAFNAYKHWHELQRALSPEAYVKYDKLQVEYDAEQRRIARLKIGAE